jgi:hypothetical protein
MRKIIISIVSILAMMPVTAHAASEGELHIGDQVVTELGAIGCKTSEDMFRVANMMLGRDPIGAMRSAASIGCRMYSTREAQQGFIEDINPGNYNACLRLRGDFACYWLPYPFLNVKH